METLIAFAALYFFISAWVFDAAMDKLLFHYDRSIFAELSNQQFWDPRVSHNNKWRMLPNGVAERDKSGSKVERFWGSSRWFVFLTDGWHLLQFLQLNSFTLAVALLLQLSMGLNALSATAVVFLSIRLGGGVIWVLFYNIFLKR